MAPDSKTYEERKEDLLDQLTNRTTSDEELRLIRAKLDALEEHSK